MPALRVDGKSHCYQQALPAYLHYLSPSSAMDWRSIYAVSGQHHFIVIQQKTKQKKLERTKSKSVKQKPNAPQRNSLEDNLKSSSLQPEAYSETCKWGVDNYMNSYYKPADDEHWTESPMPFAYGSNTSTGTEPSL